MRSEAEIREAAALFAGALLDARQGKTDLPPSSVFTAEKILACLVWAMGTDGNSVAQMVEALREAQRQ